MNRFETGESSPPNPQREDLEKTKAPAVDTKQSLQHDTPAETPSLSLINQGNSTQVESERSIEEKLDQLHNGLDGRVIKNSDGVDVTLHVTRERLTKSSEEMWYITFDYNYNGRIINRRYPQTDNYIQLSVAPDIQAITVGMAQLETQVLKGKNVYPQFLQLLGKNFPNDFDLDAEFGHETTKKSVLEAEYEYRQGKIDIEELKKKVLQTYLFRTRIASGFNYFELSFETSVSSDHVRLKVKARKDRAYTQPELIISGL